MTATEKREDRCGAFGTATGEACILPADHDGRHVLPYDAAEEITRLRAALAQSRAVVAERGDDYAAHLTLEIARRRYEATRCGNMLSCSSCPPWDELCAESQQAWANDWLAPHILAAVRALPQPGGTEGGA